MRFLAYISGKVLVIKAPLMLVLVECVACGGWNELFTLIYHVNAQVSGHLRVVEGTVFPTAEKLLHI